MKRLKKFWSKCGEEKFSGRLMTAGVTALTVVNLLIMPDDVPSEYAAGMIFFNGLMIFAQFKSEHDDKEE